MIEILADLDILTSPIIDLATLSLDGVPFGSHVTMFPRHKIVEVTFAKIVSESRSGTSIAPEYRDVTGQLLTRDAVISSVFQDDGMVHFAAKLSYKIVGGYIVGFALYGEHLNHFTTIQTPDQCMYRFGIPDRIRTDEAYGDLMGYDYYYYGSRKMVSWNSWRNQINLINLGDYEGNADPSCATG